MNPTAPVLDPATRAAARGSAIIRDNFRTSWSRMLSLYGLEVRTDKVAHGLNFHEASARWLNPGNHNHLRITRMLRCLWLCGLEEEARNTLRCVEEIYRDEQKTGRRRITPETLDYWRRAVG